MDPFFGGTSRKSLSGLSANIINQLKNINATTISASNWANLGMQDQSTSSFSMPTFQSLKLNNTSGLTVGSKTPSAAQWGYLSALDQSLATTSTPQITRLGIGAAADSTIALNVNGSVKLVSGAFIQCNATSLGTDVMFLNLKNSNDFGIYASTTTNTTNGTGLDFKYRDYNNGAGIRTGYAIGISSAGRVGIGQAGGTEALEVTGSIKSTGSLKLVNSTYTSTIAPTTLTANHTLTLPNADLTLTAYSGPNQSVSTTGTPTFASLTVGTSTPSATQWGYLSALNQSLTTGSDVRFNNIIIGGQLSVLNPELGYTNTFALSDSLASDVIICGPSTSIDLGYTPNQYVNNNSSPQFTKLGVGQAAGTNALEVSGNVKIASGSCLKLNHTDGADITTCLDFTNSSGYGFYVTQDSVANRGDTLRFRAVDHTGGTNKTWRYMLCMSPTGSVGIGQDYGTEVLEVCGNIKAVGSLILTKSLYATIITPSTTTTATRTITLPDADLTLTAYSGPNQSVSTTASPSFAGMSVTTGSLPSAAQGTLYITGSASSSTPQRMLIGDGYGWSLCMSKQSNSITTDLFTFADSGVLTLASVQGLKVGNNFPTQAQWSFMCADNQYLNTTATPQFTKLGIGQAAGTDVLEVTGNISATAELRLKNNWRMGFSTNCFNFSNWTLDNFPLQLYLNGTTTEWRCTNSSLGVKMTNGSALTSFTLNAANVYLPNITAGAGTYPVKWTSGGGLTYETSSLRFKENIKEYNADEGLIYDMKPVKFNYKNDEKKIERIGLIAETLAEIDKDEKYVIRGQDGLPEGIAYDRMIVPLIACVQALKKRIEALESSHANMS